MLLLLPEGVLSITANHRETFNLTVRALHPETIRKHFKTTVHYDEIHALPYHGSILKMHLQERMFTLIEYLDYTAMDNIRSEDQYGALLKHLQAFSNLPEAKGEKPGKAGDPLLPEAAYTLSGMVLGGYTPHPSRR